MIVSPDPPRTEWTRPRPGPDAPRNGTIYACLVVFVLGFTAVAGKLFVLQVRDAEMYQVLARKQSEMRLALHAERGSISDRRGRVIVSSARCWSFGVDLAEVQDRATIANALATVFAKPKSEFLNKMSATDGRFVWLARGIDEAQAARLEDVADPGFVRLREPQRRFELDVAAQIAGTTNVDNEGVSGVELACDSVLNGKPGFVMLQRDGLGRRRPDIDLPHVAPTSGQDLRLTLDATFQSVVEEELQRGVIESAANAGTAVMLDPRTGEILAMASAPAAHTSRGFANPDGQRCRAITDVFEPGSTFKIVAAAAALEDGLVREDERFYAERGTYHAFDATVTDVHPLGELTFADAVAQSSNICFAKLSQRFKSEVFYRYVRDFGFGIPSGIDLPGEVRGDIVKPEHSTQVSQMFNAFGYGVAVTPLQLAAAYGAIANGGVLMRPFLVKERRSAKGDVIERTQPQMVRRVVSERTAKRMIDLLCGVVEHGTGVEARLASYRVAGKTGTSQQIVDGAYSKSKYSSSFVGFFPAEHPEVVLLVTLDAPRNGYYGGAVAAPIFRRIAQRVVSSPSHLELARVADGDGAGAVVAPDVRYRVRSSADRLAAANGVRMEYAGHDELIVAQSPAPGVAMQAGGVIHATTAPRVDAADVRGMSLRQAVNLLATGSVPVRVVGSGMVSGVGRESGAMLTVTGTIAR